MITKVNNKDVSVAKKIYEIFQVSYRVEARLLKVKNFPPLSRTVEHFMNSVTDFYICWEGGEAAGAIEIESLKDLTDIHSLVVHPKYFKLGVASCLLKFVEEVSQTNLYTVETGVDNIPAVSLYKKFGYQEARVWTTDIGIRKVKFEKRRL